MIYRTSLTLLPLGALSLAALLTTGCGDEDSNGGAPSASTFIIIGPAGPPGSAGPAGPAGSPGSPGPAGPAGPPGPPGTATGPAPTNTMPGSGGDGSGGVPNVGGAGGGMGGDDVTVLVGYDDAAGDIGFAAESNTVFTDMDMVELDPQPSPTVEMEGDTSFAVFDLPFSGTAPEQFGWNANVEPPQDFTGMELVLRLRWVSGFNPDDTWGGVQLYAWSDAWANSIDGWTSLDPAQRGGDWFEVTLPLAPDAESDFDPAAVNGVGYTFNTGGTEEEPPAATPAVFHIDYIGVRPAEDTGAGGMGGGGTGGTSGGAGGTAAGGGGAGGTAMAGGGAGGSVGGAAGSSAQAGGGSGGGD